MAWTKIGETTFTAGHIGGGNPPVDVALPGTPNEGDIVLVFICDDNHQDTATTTAINTSGYTLIGADYVTHLPDWEISYKIMGSAPDSVVNVDRANDLNIVLCGVVQVWRNADGTISLDGASATATGASGMPDAPVYTVSNNGCLVFAVGFLDDDDAASGSSAPAGYSNFVATQGGSGSGQTESLFIASKQADAGSENPAAFGGSGTDDWVGVTFALKVTATMARPRLSLMGCGA